MSLVLIGKGLLLEGCFAQKQGTNRFQVLIHGLFLGVKSPTDPITIDPFTSGTPGHPRLEAVFLQKKIAARKMGSFHPPPPKKKKKNIEREKYHEVKIGLENSGQMVHNISPTTRFP